MQTPWHLVPPGSTVRGHDGYVWDVRTVGKPDSDAPRGSVRVVMFREGRGELVGHPPAGVTIELLTSPAPVAPLPERVALANLRASLGVVEVLDCAWCSGDSSAECLCDVNCGASGCINFR